MRILLVWAGSATSTTANLYRELERVLSEKHAVQNRIKPPIRGNRFVKIIFHFLWDMRGWPQVIRADALIFHSYMAIWTPTILLAKLLRKRIIVLHWDVYPTTIDGQRIGGPLSPVLDRLESFCVMISDRVVVPSEDFTPHIRHQGLKILPLWPSGIVSAPPVRKVRKHEYPIRIAFAGQALITRGLPNAIKRLGMERHQRFEIHIFAPTAPEKALSDLAENVSVHYAGYLGRNELADSLAGMDLGLISLHPGMGQAGFPSKVFDYVAAGLPVIYTGRPLPAFCAMIERVGVGFALGKDAVDWACTLDRLVAGMPEATRRFLGETELTLEKLERAFFSECEDYPK